MHSRHKALGSTSKNSKTQACHPSKRWKQKNQTVKVIFWIVGSWTAGLRACLKQNP